MWKGGICDDDTYDSNLEPYSQLNQYPRLIEWDGIEAT